MTQFSDLKIVRSHLFPKDLVDEKSSEEVKRRPVENTKLTNFKKGTSLVVQNKRSNFNRSELCYDLNSSLIKPSDNSLERPPYSHITFVVSNYETENT